MATFSFWLETEVWWMRTQIWTKPSLAIYLEALGQSTLFYKSSGYPHLQGGPSQHLPHQVGLGSVDKVPERVQHGSKWLLMGPLLIGWALKQQTWWSRYIATISRHVCPFCSQRDKNSTIFCWVQEDEPYFCPHLSPCSTFSIWNYLAGVQETDQTFASGFPLIVWK